MRTQLVLLYPPHMALVDIDNQGMEHSHQYTELVRDRMVR